MKWERWTLKPSKCEGSGSKDRAIAKLGKAAYQLARVQVSGAQPPSLAVATVATNDRLFCYMLDPPGSNAMFAPDQDPYVAYAWDSSSRPVKQSARTRLRMGMGDYRDRCPPRWSGAVVGAVVGAAGPQTDWGTRPVCLTDDYGLSRAPGVTTMPALIRQAEERCLAFPLIRRLRTPRTAKRHTSR